MDTLRFSLQARTLRSLVTIPGMLGFLVLVGIWGSHDDASGSQGEAEGISTNAGRETLDALADKMQDGRPYGEGPDGQAIADALQTRYPEDAIAVRVVPGSPRHIVVLMRFTDLVRIDDDRRREYMNDFASTLDLRFLGREARIGIGLKGRVFNGAVATREPGEDEFSMEISSTVDDAPLRRILARPPGELATGPTVHVGDRLRGAFDEDDGFGYRRWTTEIEASTIVHIVGRRSDGVAGPDRNAVFTTLCRGNTFNSNCPSIKDEETNEARLDRGTYTLWAGIETGCDTDAQLLCWRTPTPFEIDVTRL